MPFFIYIIVATAMFWTLLFIAVVTFMGGKAISRKPEEISAKPGTPLPLITVIVPATGKNLYLEQSLSALFSQDYPNYEVIVVTKSENDPATSRARESVKAVKNARLIIAGEAAGCGQKNHNLLGGYKAMNQDTEILVFCDSTRLAKKEWLSLLTAPIINGKTAVSTGYHDIIPKNDTFGTIGMVRTVLMLYLSQGLAAYVQPWGGSTAISREIFDSLKVADMWAVNIVDDASLAALLKNHDQTVLLAPGARLSTPTAVVKISQWSVWLTRQWQYLKFTFPLYWLFGGSVAFAAAILVIISVLFCFLAIVGQGPAPAGLLGFIFLGSFAVLAAVSTKHHPSPLGWFYWILSIYALFFVASWSHFKSALTNKILWHGITYSVGPGGVVRSINVDSDRDS